MRNLEDTLKSCYTKELERRKNWYSPVAEAYDKFRPRYPQNLINRVVKLTQLSPQAKILEIGCGPGTATVDFAQFGFSMLCLEPNPDFYQLVQQNCQQYPNVEICNTSLEEYQLGTEKFDIVLAANAWHWIPPEVKYSKAANALKNNGYLVLLWNMTPEPKYEIYQVLKDVYQEYAPQSLRYEGREIQIGILQGFGKNILNSELFQDLISEHIPCEVTHNTDDYLMLLSTFSAYHMLEPQDKNALFEGLRDKINQNFGGRIQVFYESAFHIARKA